jgi:DnaK suppressor protein
MPNPGEPNRKALEAALLDVLGPGAEREELVVQQYADPMDQVQSGVTREVAGQRLESRARQARAIREALERIATGTYGVCKRCAERIGEKRLNAVPWALLCVACQAQDEAGKMCSPVLPAAA